MRPRRPLSPTEKLRRRRKAELAARRAPTIKPGTSVVYRGAGKRPQLVKVVRQTATGRVTVRLPSGKLVSIKPRFR